MGCDFYIDTDICIETKDGKFASVSDGRLNGYYPLGEDADFFDYKKYLDSFKEKKTVYENNTWYIVENAIPKYQEILKKKGIELENVVKIYKSTYISERY